MLYLHGTINAKSGVCDGEFYPRFSKMSNPWDAAGTHEGLFDFTSFLFLIDYSGQVHKKTVFPAQGTMLTVRAVVSMVSLWVQELSISMVPLIRNVMTICRDEGDCRDCRPQLSLSSLLNVQCPDSSFVPSKLHRLNYELRARFIITIIALFPMFSQKLRREATPLLAVDQPYNKKFT